MPRLQATLLLLLALALALGQPLCLCRGARASSPAAPGCCEPEEQAPRPGDACGEHEGACGCDESVGLAPVELDGAAGTHLLLAASGFPVLRQELPVARPPARVPLACARPPAPPGSARRLPLRI